MQSESGQPAKRVLGKFTPWLMCAVLAVQGLLLWRAYRKPDAPPAAPAPAAAQRPPTADEMARFAFFTDGAIPHQLRISMLRQTFAEGCSSADLACLYQLLLETKPPGRDGEEIRFVLANDLMGQLCRHDPDPDRFTGRLVSYMGDSSRHPVLRDYAVQHLAAWLDPRRALPRGSVPPATGWSALRASVLAALARTASDPALAATTVPGTVLMSLCSLSRTDREICAEAFATLRPWLASALGGDSNLSLPVRVSAVHAAASADPAGYLPVFRAIAYRPDGTPAIRLAAINAIGRFGSQSDLPSLREVSASTPSLAVGVAAAVRSLSSRAKS